MIPLSNGHGPFIGSACPRENCSGVLGVLNTRVRADINRRFQYLGCKKCGCRPQNNLRVIPLEYAPPSGRGGVRESQK